MKLTDLPLYPSHIDSAIAAASREGARSVARLAMLCLWKAGQRTHPKSVYAGPEGKPPLDYLLNALEHFRKTPELHFVTSWGFETTKRQFPTPTYDRPAQDVSDAAARDEVNKVIRESNAAPPIRKEYLICIGLRDFAQRGFKAEHLKPLIHRVIDMVSEPPHYNHMQNRLEALIAADEFEAADRIVVVAPITVRSGLYDHIALARLLVQRARYDAAREHLRNLLNQRSLWLRDDPEKGTLRVSFYDAQIAELYTYMGDHALARELLYRVVTPDLLKIATIALLRQLYDRQPLNVKPILSLVPDIAKGASEKGSAATQIDILRMMLELGLEPEALSLLPALFDTLHRVPLWGKYEFRVHDAALALVPVAHRHEVVIFPFVRDLLIASAQPHDKESAEHGFWRVTHTVCALGSLIKVCVSEADYQQLIDFVMEVNR